MASGNSSGSSGWEPESHAGNFLEYNTYNTHYNMATETKYIHDLRYSIVLGLINQRCFALLLSYFIITNNEYCG